MASQASQFDCNVTIYFVVLSKYESEDNCADQMWNAYNKCCEYDLDPEWITEDECYSIAPDKSMVFVMEEFTGDAFEKLNSYNAVVIGPQCLLICFNNGETIPDGPNPIYTTAMRDICVCVSGLSKDEKEHIQRLVEFMGGVFTKQLRTSVTHLITDSVLSTKYKSAVGMQIQIVKKEWVESVWNANLKGYVKPSNTMFDKYKCPVFMNLIITSTNLTKRQKEELKNLINNNGGTYMGPLDGSIVNIVLAPENSPLSDKLKYAMQSNIVCVNTNWIYDSINTGYVLPFDDYLIKSTKACSTPEKCHGNASFNVSTISAIQCDTQRNYVDESTATIANFSTMDHFAATTTPEIPVIDRLTLGNAKKAGTFLDGCNIYLAGFTQRERDKLNKILSIGGAIRMDDISHSLTHVIVGNGSKASKDLAAIKLEECCPYLLTLDWLEESIRLKQPAPEERFLYESKNNANRKTTELLSPLSKKNLIMLINSRKPSILPSDTDKKTPSKKSDNNPIQQYFEETVGTSETVQEFLKPYDPTLDSKTPKQIQSAKKQQEIANISASTIGMRHSSSGNDSAVPLSQGSIIGERIFNGLTFAVSGFANEDNYVAESIIALGGEVVTRNFTGIPDYGVVPAFGSPLKQTVNEIVTNLFIEDCINIDRIVDIRYYHRPLTIDSHSKPLSTCVITMSMYSGGERAFLSSLAVELGAVFQDTFARKTNVAKNTLASTHLVCPTAEGNKYNAAVKWKLPAVTAEWLKACAAESRLVDETPYLVGSTIAPDRPTSNDMNKEASEKYNQEIIPPSAVPALEDIVTPKRDPSKLQEQTDSAGSLLINKRFNLVMSKTPPSPFHIATPETPYGQIFKPNPSPETRKGWKKWVDNLPDLYISEPPIKRRPPSTPLSDLKRQLWQKLKNAGNNTEDKINSPNAETVEKRKEVTPLTSPDNKRSTTSNSTDDDVIPISRKLVYDENNSPHEDEINDQIAQLEEAFERIPSTSQSRYSVPNKNAVDYNAESAPMDKDSQPGTVGWEHSNPMPLKSVNAKSPVPEDNEPTNTDPAILSNFEDVEFDTMSKFGSKIDPPVTRKFMLSGMKDRVAYEQVIQDLGGEISIDPNFDITATHLLCTRPARNEKMLGSIAAGKWILHCSYLRDSEKEGHFLDEEEYEWGNPKSKDVIPNLTGNTEKAIAAAAYKWRLKLTQEPYGAFYGMVALLMVVGDKYDQFKRLIEAGGGTVVQARHPYDAASPDEKITHCFVNVKQISQPVDWAMLASKGILCFLPQYLSDQLTAVTPLNPQDCVLPEFKKYLSLLRK